MGVTVDPEGFAEAIKSMLDEYGKEVNEVLDPALRRTANKVKREVKAKAPGSGEYAGSWAVQKQTSRLSTSYVVYSKKPGLPHLLEFGHALRNGDRSRSFPHIEASSNEAADEIVKQIERALK